MAQSPSPPSVVVKTSKPTPAQKTQTAAAKPKPVLSARAKNILATDPQYGGAGDPLGTLKVRTVAPSQPVKTGAHGLVTNPINDALAHAHPLPNAPAKAPKVKVQVHPDGTVTVHHGGASATATPTPYHAPAAGAPPVGGSSSVPPDLRPGAKPPHAPKVKPSRAPAAAGGAPVAAAPPNDAATASSVINSILAPIIKQITDSENARAEAGQQAIGGYTQNAQDQLKGIDFQAPFTGAVGGENAINTALLARLGGQGSALQDQLQGQLGGVDPGLASAIGGNANATANGAANAGLATGDATTSSLLSQGANAGVYGKKLPAITSLAGAQDTGKLQGQVASDLKTQLGDIQSKVPGMIQSELTTLSTARTAAEKNRIAQIIAEGYDPSTGQLTPKARAALASATGVDPLTGKPTAKTQIAKTKADGAAAATQQRLALEAAKVYGVDANGNPTLAARKAATQAALNEKKASSMSPTAYGGLLQKASKAADDFYSGVAPTTRADGSVSKPGVPPVLYPKALHELLAEGVKYKDALAILDARYQPGEGGRPLPKSPPGPKVKATSGFGSTASLPGG